MVHARLRLFLSASSMALACLGMAQTPQSEPAAPPQAQPAEHGTQAPPPRRIGQPPAAPPFKSLMEIDSSGKLVHIDESLDLKAIGNNHLITMEDRAKLAPAVSTWLDDIDQLTIDNLDYLEQIEPLDGSPGMFATMDTEDSLQQKRAASMMTQLMSAGQLTTAMQTKGLLTAAQAGMNQAIINEYLQAMMNEIVQKHGGARQNLTPEEQKKQTKAVTAFLYYMTSRDAIEAYRRLISNAAPVADQALAKMSLSADQSAKLAPLAAAAKNTSAGPDRRAAMDALLKAMTFDQRREFLAKARELGPSRGDPFASLPPPPPAPASRPFAPPPPAPAADHPTDHPADEQHK